MKKKMNNKGFSLVELIIVIAIMAVLVGVLAPAYMRYVENSRKSRDVSALDTAMTAVETTLIDYCARQNDADESVTISVGATISATGATGLQAELNAVLGTYTMASTWDSAGADEITATCTDGRVTFSNTGSGTMVDVMEAYSAALSGRITP